MDNLYLLIKCGYEGIEELVYPSNSKKEIIDKIISIRKKINSAKEKRKNLSDDEFIIEEKWDELLERKEIDWETYCMGAYDNEEQYCIQKWNGEQFECCCKDLNVDLNKDTWFY